MFSSPKKRIGFEEAQAAINLFLGAPALPLKSKLKSVQSVALCTTLGESFDIQTRENFLADQEFDLIFRTALPPAESGCPNLDPRTERPGEMVIQYDAAVPMRDGAKQISGPHSLGAVRKVRRLKYFQPGNTGLDDEDFNRYTKCA
jgi:hypothetical protein